MIAALIVAAMATPSACARIGPLYWEVGDAGGAIDRGIHGSTIGPDTVVPIASATKWLFAAYVAQTGKLQSKEAKDALLMISGYSNMQPRGCIFAPTVASCAERAGGLDPKTVGRFDYNGGHDQHLAVVLGLGPASAEELGKKLSAALGVQLEMRIPQPAAGASMSATQYAAFLRKLLKKELKLSASLGKDAVGEDTVYSPAPRTWRYSYGHFVEDDGAFSSPGAFGFYPWIAGRPTASSPAVPPRGSRTWRPSSAAARSAAPSRPPANDRRAALRKAGEEVRRRHRRRRARSRHEARRVLRPARPERRRQDHDRRDPRGAQRSDRRRRAGARPALGHRRAWLRERLGISLQETHLHERLTVRRDAAAVPQLLSIAAATSRGALKLVSLEREARHLVRQALGRAEAAARRRLRARRRSRAAVSRRADDRARSAVAPPAVGRGRRLARRGAHGALDHALHGRGGAALRSRRRSSITAR